MFQGKRCFGFGRDNVLEAAPSVTITDAVPVFETTNLESCRGVLRIAHWLWGGLTVYAGAVALHHGDKDWFITG